MSHHRIFCFLCMFLGAALEARAAEAPKGDAEVKTSVRVSFEMPKDPVPQGEPVGGFVFLLSGDRCLGRKGTRFAKTPVIFEDIPEGKASVVVIPVLNHGKWGLWGQAETVVVKGQVNDISVRIEKGQSTSVKMKVLGLEGKPFAKNNVHVSDVAAGDFVYDDDSLTTDDQGVVEFRGFPGRQYKVGVRLGVPFTMVSSPPLTVRQEGGNIATWRITPGRLVRIRFFEERNGRRLPFREVGNVYVNMLSSEGRSRGYSTPVMNGELVLFRDLGYLKQGKRVAIECSSARADYEIAHNATFDLIDTPGRDQAVEIVLVRRVEAKYFVSGVDEATKIPLKVVVYAKEIGTGRLLRGDGVVPQLVLPTGLYVLLVCCPDYKSVEQKVQVTKIETVRLEIPMQPAPRLKGTVLGSDGKPIAGASIALHYRKATFVKTGRDRTSEAGTFDLPVDDNLSPLLRVVTKNHHGSCLVDLAGVKIQKSLEIRLEVYTVNGKLEIDPTIERSDKMGILWTILPFPRFLLNACPVKEGSYQVSLEKGVYHRYLSDGQFLLPLDDVEVSGAEGQELPKITVTKEMWEKGKKSAKNYLDEF